MFKLCTSTFTVKLAVYFLWTKCSIDMVGESSSSNYDQPVCRPQRRPSRTSSRCEPKLNPLWRNTSRRSQLVADAGWWSVFCLRQDVGNRLHLCADPHRGINRRNSVEIYDVSSKLQAFFCETAANIGLSVAEFTVCGTRRGGVVVALPNENKRGFTAPESGLKTWACFCAAPKSVKTGQGWNNSGFIFVQWTSSACDSASDTMKTARRRWQAGGLTNETSWGHFFTGMVTRGRPVCHHRPPFTTRWGLQDCRSFTSAVALTNIDLC